ncbi:MAG: InlB B-repeat-containing protein [Clostridiales bacterium]|nr:InlB B-repeat-containing protein [Clostridiales bacterium]
MKKTRKVLLASAMAAVLSMSALGLAACGDEKTPETPTPDKGDKQYTVTFKVNNGAWTDGTTADLKLKTDKNGKLSATEFPKDPVREDYTFEGWVANADGTGTTYTFSSTFAKDTTVYAKWEEEEPEGPPAGTTYTITLDANGGVLGGNGSNTVTTGTDGKLTAMPADPSRENYTFDGWYTQAEGGAEITLQYVFTANGTIYAHWTENGEVKPDPEEGYTITLDANGGSFSDEQAQSVTTDKNGKLTALPDAPATAPEGQKFAGWATAAEDGEAVTLETVFESNSTIYAVWEDDEVEQPEPGTYTITLNAGEGTLEGEGTLTTGEDGKLEELPEPTPPEGYDFDGWYTQAEGGDAVTTDTVFEANGTIYAHYSEALTISATELTLSIGKRTETLTVTSSHGDVTWTSNATAVVTVTGGALKALKPGTATITATSGTKTAKCEVTVEDAYYLIGGEDASWNKVGTFDVATAIYFMPTETAGVYSTGSIELSRNAEFQIALVGDTTGNWWQKAFNAGNVTMSGDVSGSNNFSVSTHGKYTIKLDLSGAKAAVNVKMDEDLSGGVVEIDRWYIIGSMTGWSTKAKDADLGIYGFEYHADTGKYTLTIQLTKGGEFKVVIAGSGYNGEIGEGGVADGKIGTKGTATEAGKYQLEWTSSTNIGVGVTGWYTFTLDPSVSGRGRLDYTFSTTNPNA